ncbi:MAG: phage baseplate assembly protein V [Byssovorax sp.]
MIEDLLQQLVDRLEHRYYGKYRGYVHNVDDPLKIGRIQAIVPRLLGDTPTGWALPCAPFAGPDQGLYVVPDVGTGVWIEFEGGDLSSPIWSGSWWGAPAAADVGLPDSTAAAHRTTPETPQHRYPREPAEPGVRILKSATGHHIVLDDRADSARIEIHDSLGNRIILSKEGLIQLVSNERTVNKGSRGTQIDQSDKTTIGRHQEESVAGHHTRKVGGDVSLEIGGSMSESVLGGAFRRTVDDQGITETFVGPRATTISGSDSRQVAGAGQDVVLGGYGLVAGGSVNIASAGGSVNIAGAMPDVPSLNAVSIDALLGNVSINTKLGFLQLGGPTAISPMVLGDGFLIQLLSLAQILKAINPLTLPAYGPALDAWAAALPLLNLSMFGAVKRFPVG